MNGHVDLGIWGKLSRVIVILLLMALALGAVLWYWPLFEQNERMRQEILLLHQEIQSEEELARQLKASIFILQKDTKTIERLAREKLGYAKPGETVIRFEATATPSNAPGR